MPRLFVALHLPEPLKQGIRELQSGLRNARWLTEDCLHLTLAFIGEVDGCAQRRIEAALGNVAAPALRMELHRLGCFPPRGAPRVLWTGASAKAELVSLARTVRRALGQAGVAPQRRKFVPHVTIARFHRPPPPAELESYLGARSAFRTPRVDVASLHLFSSMLRSCGARYTIETTIPLTRASRGNSDPKQEHPSAAGDVETAGGRATEKTFEPAGEHTP